MARVSVGVSPRVGVVDEGAVIATVLDYLQSSHPLGGEFMTEQWRQAHTLRIVRREPVETRTKTLPLYVIRSAPVVAAGAVTAAAEREL